MKMLSKIWQQVFKMSEEIAELIAMKIVMAAMSLIPTHAGVDAGARALVGIPSQVIRKIWRSNERPRESLGIMRLSMGGIARGRDAGYPAVLHGTEAVVPLPNNRSIPVDLQGDRGTQNNVTVNVTMTEGGAGSRNAAGDSQQGTNLGNAIAMAVQKELQNQKRSGGILNPYGAA